MVDTEDLKSSGSQEPYRFKSGLRQILTKVREASLPGQRAVSHLIDGPVHRASAQTHPRTSRTPHIRDGSTQAHTDHFGADRSSGAIGAGEIDRSAVPTPGGEVG